MQEEDPIVSDLGRTRSIKETISSHVKEKEEKTYKAKQQYYNGMPSKARAWTHQLNLKKKEGWAWQDGYQKLSAPPIAWRQDHLFAASREAVRFGQQAKMPIKLRCAYNRLDTFRPMDNPSQLASVSRNADPVALRHGTKQTMKGTEQVALKPAEKSFVNFMDEPMTDREIQQLKLKATKQNPQVLETIRQLYKMTNMIRVRLRGQPAAAAAVSEAIISRAAGRGGKDDPPQTPTGAPKRRRKRSPGGDETKGDDDEGGTYAVEDAAEDVDPNAWIKDIVARLRQAKDEAGDRAEEKPNGDAINKFISRQIPEALKAQYESLGAKSSWDFEDFIEALEKVDGPIEEEAKKDDVAEAKQMLEGLRKDVLALPRGQAGSVKLVADLFEKHKIKLPDQQRFGRQKALAWISQLMAT